MPYLFFVSVTKRNSSRISERSEKPGPGFLMTCDPLATVEGRFWSLVSREGWIRAPAALWSWHHCGEKQVPGLKGGWIRAAADLWSWRHCGECRSLVSREGGLELLLTCGPGATVERRDPRSQGRAGLKLLLTCGPGATVERRDLRSQGRAGLMVLLNCGPGATVERRDLRSQGRAGLMVLLTCGPGATVERRDPGLKGELDYSCC